MINEFGGYQPVIDESAFIHESAVIIGNVEIKKNAGIWCGATIRGDVEKITVGENSNIQDNCILHTGKGMPMNIGNNVVVGHGVNLHSCTIEDNALIGIGSILLDGAYIGKNCIVAAGSLVSPGKKFAEGKLLMGTPAKAVRDITEKDIHHQRTLVKAYRELANKYKKTEKHINK